MTFAKIDWPNKLFVTGIDTDAGKSYATGWLASEIKKAGKESMTLKFVQTGNKDFSEDILVHRKLMGIELTSYDKLGITSPEIFTYPCSPELAARIDGRDIDLKKITDAINELSRNYKTVLIEGAGGLMVPLKGDYLTIDYVREYDLPIALVTNGRLGSISHTLLALYAIKHYGLTLHTVIYNSYFDYDKIIAEDTRNYIRNWIDNHFKNVNFLEMGSF